MSSSLSVPKSGPSLSAWRIVKAKYEAQAWDGEGARLYGGRWNSPGTPLIYTSSSRALATLEMLVHLRRDSVLPAYRLCAAHFEPGLVTDVDPSHLPTNWADPVAPAALRTLGDGWSRGLSSVVLRVPSAVVSLEDNYLINPLHPDFHLLRFDAPTPFEFDGRLFDKPKS